MAAPDFKSFSTTLPSGDVLTISNSPHDSQKITVTLTRPKVGENGPLLVGYELTAKIGSDEKVESVSQRSLISDNGVTLYLRNHDRSEEMFEELNAYLVSNVDS